MSIGFYSVNYIIPNLLRQPAFIAWQFSRRSSKRGHGEILSIGEKAMLFYFFRSIE